MVMTAVVSNYGSNFTNMSTNSFTFKICNSAKSVDGVMNVINDKIETKIF